MADLDIGKTTVPTELTAYTVASASTDGVVKGEKFQYNEDFPKYYGIYKKIAKVKIAINAWATWVLGKGITSKTHQSFIDNMNFMAFLWNMLVIKKVNRDSFAEVIRNDRGTLLDLKPLDPGSIVTVFDIKGKILRYEQITKTDKPNRRIEPIKMLHLMNDRVADNTRGTSALEGVEWNIEAQEEARRVHRKKVRNSGIIGIVEVDSQDEAKITALKVPIKKGIEEGNLLMVPKDTIAIKPWEVKLNTSDTLVWLNYLEDEMYMLLGIPKPIIGGTQSGEGDTKMSYLSFEQYYARAVEELKSELWNQLAMRIEINKPVSIKEDVQDTQAKNTGQVGFQPNDTTATVGRE